MKEMLTKKSWIQTLFTLALLLMAVATFQTPVHAAKKPAAPKGIKVEEGSYYHYWDKHRSELKKAGYSQGDGYDAIVSWKKVNGAKGYVATVYWVDDEGDHHKTVVNVKKVGNQYDFSTKGTKFRYYYSGEVGYMHFIAKNESDFIKKGSVKKFRSNKLSFQISGDGSCICIQKVQIKSYKVVKGKKVYSKTTTKKIRNSYY